MASRTSTYFYFAHAGLRLVIRRSVTGFPIQLQLSLVGADDEDLFMSLALYGRLFAHFGNRGHDRNGDCYFPQDFLWRSSNIENSICCHVYMSKLLLGKSNLIL